MSTGGESKRAEFTAVALPYMDNLYSTALYLTRSPDDAAELLQDTLLRAYRSWHLFTPGTNCKAWLLTILYNAFRNQYRAQSRIPEAVEFDDNLYTAEPGDTTAALHDPAELIAAQVLDGEVETALQQLPREFLEAVLLVDIQDLTYEEAAAVANCPVGTIRSRLSRGRHLLQHALRHYAKERGLVR